MRESAHELTGSTHDYEPLLDLLGDARFALIGEASHGTHEFYFERAEITKRLIVEKGYTAIAVEADWPDAYRVNRYVRGISDDADANAALSGFKRFPAWAGKWNVGELVRKRYGRESVLVGFSTHRGTVTAASDWGGAAERKRVRPGLTVSYEELFHAVGLARFLLALRGRQLLATALKAPRLRAIGVIYRPETERQSHYFYTRLVEQFDAMIHIDETRALQPLEPAAGWIGEEAPETYPSGV